MGDFMAASTIPTRSWRLLGSWASPDAKAARASAWRPRYCRATPCRKYAWKRRQCMYYSHTVPRKADGDSLVEQQVSKPKAEMGLVQNPSKKSVIKSDFFQHFKMQAYFFQTHYIENFHSFPNRTLILSHSNLEFLYIACIGFWWFFKLLFILLLILLRSSRTGFWKFVLSHQNI